MKNTLNHPICIVLKGLIKGRKAFEFSADGSFVQDIVSAGLNGLLTPNAVVVRPIITSAIAPLPVSNLYITPTTGSVFYLNQNQSTQYNRITIFNASGQVIVDKPYEGNLIWDAQQQSAGTYFIHLFSKKGERHTEQVIVNKE